MDPQGTPEISRQTEARFRCHFFFTQIGLDQAWDAVAVLVLVGLDDSQVVVAVSRKRIVHEIQADFLASRIQRVDDRTVSDNHHFLDLVRAFHFGHDPWLAIDLDLFTHEVIVDLEVQHDPGVEHGVVAAVP